MNGVAVKSFERSRACVSKIPQQTPVGRLTLYQARLQHIPVVRKTIPGMPLLALHQATSRSEPVPREKAHPPGPLTVRPFSAGCLCPAGLPRL